MIVLLLLSIPFLFFNLLGNSMSFKSQIKSPSPSQIPPHQISPITKYLQLFCYIVLTALNFSDYSVLFL